MEDAELKEVEWLEPWRPVNDPELADHLRDELQREANPRHVLFRKSVRAVGYTQDEDVLYIAEGTPRRLAVVHLTGSGKQDLHDSFPFTTFYDNVQSFVIHRMRVDHKIKLA